MEKSGKKTVDHLKYQTMVQLLEFFTFYHVRKTGALYQYINNKAIIYTFILQMHSEKNVLFGI